MLGKLLTKTACGILVGLTGILFIGYCIYFDYQRHLDPEFKKKLRERRRRNRKESAMSPGEGIPDMSNQNDIERYFMTQVQKGESLIVRGDIEGAVDHFINAVIVCSQPAKLVHVLQGVLPVEVFNKLITKMQAYEKMAQRPTIIIGEALSPISQKQ